MASRKVQLPDGTTGQQLLNAAAVASTEGSYMSSGRLNALFAGQYSSDSHKSILVSATPALSAQSGIDPSKVYSEIWLLNYQWRTASYEDNPLSIGQMRKARERLADRLVAALR